MQVQQNTGARVIDMAAFRAARARDTKFETRTSEVLGIQYCDAADSAAWYHGAAVTDERKR